MAKTNFINRFELLIIFSLPFIIVPWSAVIADAQATIAGREYT
jgi:hypothetical protein